MVASAEGALTSAIYGNVAYDSKTYLMVVPEQRHSRRPWRHARGATTDLHYTMERICQNGKRGDHDK